MDVIISVFTVFFVILSAILVIIILLQSDKSAGMGILGGSSQTTFGSSTADVITKITTIMVALFMLTSLGLAVLESYKATSMEKDLITTDSKVPVLSEDKVEGGKNNAAEQKSQENKSEK